MKVQIEFHTDNAAFEDCGFEEFEHVTKLIFLSIVNFQDETHTYDDLIKQIKPIRDSYGNTIGRIIMEKS